MRRLQSAALALAATCAAIATPVTARAEGNDRSAEREAMKREIAAALGSVLAAARSAGASGADTSWSRALARTSSHDALWRASLDDAAVALSAGVERAEGAGVALERVATVGRGDGVEPGAVDHGRSALTGEHVVRAPSLRSIGGRLPPEAIQRVVRASFGAMDVCYEAGLRRAPELRGRVVIRATIAPSGAVDTVLDAGSDLPDAGVVRCVVRTFATLAFPRSGAGPVTVLYPLTFTPAAALVRAGR